MRITLFAAAGLSAVAFALAQPVPASAHAVSVNDPADLDHGVDLRSVALEYEANNVVVTTTHANLLRSFRSGAAGTVYLDTDDADAGPEFVFVGGYFAGADYQLLRTEGFGRTKWGERVEGDYQMRLDYSAERVRMRVSHPAIGSPDQVRVAVRVSGAAPDGTNKRLTDWLGEPRSFTEWAVQ